MTSTNKRLGDWIEKRLQPIANWVARNPYLQVLTQTFVSLLPLIVVGAFALILSKSPVNYTGFMEGSRWYNFFKAWTDWSNANLQTLKFVNSATLGSLSLWVAVGIAYRWARKHDLDVMSAIIVAFVNFLLINSEKVDATWSTAYFGGEGLFSAIIFTFLTVELYRWLIKKGIGKVTFPASVPAILAHSISTMLPMALTFFGGCMVAGVTANVFHTTIPKVILSVGAPLNTAIDNPFGMSLVSVFGQVAWWFGIHNNAVFSVISPVLYSNLSVNAEAYAAGVLASKLPYIVNQSFFFSYCALGGSGATFSLVVLMLKSKSETLRTVGKLSFLPACFGINEPVIFGCPLVMNVVLLIPFLFVQVVNIFIVYFAMAWGLLNRPIFYMGGTAPEIIKGVLCNMDFRSAIIWVLLAVIDLVLWYPFFKAFEKQKLDEEALALSQEV